METSPIVLVCNTAWGIVNFRGNIASQWVKEGYRVVGIAPYEEKCVLELKRIGVEFYSLDLDNHGGNPVKDVKVVWQLYKLYRLLKPRFVVHYTIKPVIYGGWASYLAGVPSLAVVTGLGYVFLNDSFKARVARKLYKSSLDKALEVWFLNLDDQRLFVDRKIVDPLKTKILPGEGVNTDFFKSIDHSSSTDKRVRLLLIARLLYDKGIGEFAEVGRYFSKLKSIGSCDFDFEFQLLGPFYSENPQAIPQAVVDNWVRDGCLSYLGKSDDVRPILGACDALVLPSYGEGLPRTVLEAMSMGKPVIATNVSGCKDLVVDGETGILCEPRDVDSLRLAIEKFISLTHEQRLQLGKNGRNTVELNFSDQKVISFYGEFMSRWSLDRFSND